MANFSSEDFHKSDLWSLEISILTNIILSITIIDMISKNTTNISAMEARKRFGEIMNLVALRGETFTVARAGKPLARIVPIVTEREDDIFERPFVTFTEWDDSSNDAYDSL